MYKISKKAIEDNYSYVGSTQEQTQRLLLPEDGTI